MLKLRERNENYNGIYIVDFYDDRDFVLAIVAKSIDKKVQKQLLDKVEFKGEFLGVFENENDIINYLKN